MEWGIKHKFFSILVFFIFSSGVFHSQNSRKASAVIKSSVECELCKKNVENKLSKIKGVKRVKVDYNSHEVKVIYNSNKIRLEEIKKAISELGYDADEIPANNRMNKILKHKNQQLIK